MQHISAGAINETARLVDIMGSAGAGGSTTPLALASGPNLGGWGGGGGGGGVPGSTTVTPPPRGRGRLLTPGSVGLVGASGGPTLDLATNGQVRGMP